MKNNWMFETNLLDGEKTLLVSWQLMWLFTNNFVVLLAPKLYSIISKLDFILKISKEIEIIRICIKFKNGKVSYYVRKADSSFQYV